MEENASQAQTEKSVNPGLADVHLEFEIISTTNGFFGTVRNLTLDSGYVAELDLSAVHQLLQSDNSDLSLEDRKTLAQEHLKKLREELDGIDKQLDPGKFRRVFERIGDPSTHSLELVIQYYLSKTTKNRDDRDKVDLLVTRWGSYNVPSSHNLTVLRPANDLETKLVELYTTLHQPLPSSEDQDNIMEALKRFADEIARIGNFRDIVEQQLVKRLREYKAGIDELFYHPKVLSKIVEINTAIHNLFQQLYDSEQARLHLFLEQAKKSAINDEQSRQLAQFQPIFKMMNRASQMDHLIDDIKQALASQQVVDQAFIDQMERTGQKMRDLTELLVKPLQSSRTVSEQLHRSLSNIQRLEKLSFAASALEKQILENAAAKSERNMEQLLSAIFEDALIKLAQAAKDNKLAEAFPNQSDAAKTAVSELIGTGLTESN